MKECPQCHNLALDSDKFCKQCGTPLEAVPVMAQEQAVPQPAASDEPAASEPAVSGESAAPEPAAPVADSAMDTAGTPLEGKRPPRKKTPFLIAAAVVVALGIIGIIVGTRNSDKPKEIVEIPVDDAVESLKGIYDSREFDEKLDLSQHPGLVTAEDVTGPFLELRKSDGSFYVADTSVDNKDKGKLPSDVEIVEAKEDSFPKEYRQLIQSGKNAKAAAKGKEPMVYALMEYTGYGLAGNYNNGGFKLYYHTSRVSFYSTENNEMLGWVNTTESRTGPFILYSNQYGSDGTHPILYFKDDTIWSDKAWTNGLDELFYDENGYQVVGTRLLSVPEDVDTIEVPEGVKEIENGCGSGHKATKLILPKGVEKIGQGAFNGSALKEIEVPKSVTYCKSNVFSNTPWMEEQAKDDWVIIGDGVLLKCTDKDAEELTVPDDVHYIAPWAFSELSCKKITIPSSVV